jgi:hypothetical protein
MDYTDEELDRGKLVDRLQVAKLRYLAARRKVMQHLPPAVSREVLDAKHEVETLEEELFNLDWTATNAPPPGEAA